MSASTLSVGDLSADGPDPRTGTIPAGVIVRRLAGGILRIQRPCTDQECMDMSLVEPSKFLCDEHGHWWLGIDVTSGNDEFRDAALRRLGGTVDAPDVDAPSAADLGDLLAGRGLKVRQGPDGAVTLASGSGPQSGEDQASVAVVPGLGLVLWKPLFLSRVDPRAALLLGGRLNHLISRLAVNLVRGRILASIVVLGPPAAWAACVPGDLRLLSRFVRAQAPVFKALGGGEFTPALKDWLRGSPRPERNFSGNYESDADADADADLNDDSARPLPGQAR